MPSNQHQDMVSAIHKFFCEEYGHLDRHKWIIRMDHDKSEFTPKLLNGRRPDFQASRYSPDMLVIGEAKSTDDIQTERSQNQINSFIHYLASLNQTSVLILCVALCNISDAKRLIRSHEKHRVVKVRLIDQLGYEYRHAGWN